MMGIDAHEFAPNDLRSTEAPLVSDNVEISAAEQDSQSNVRVFLNENCKSDQHAASTCSLAAENAVADARETESCASQLVLLSPAVVPKAEEESNGNAVSGTEAGQNLHDSMGTVEVKEVGHYKEDPNAEVAVKTLHDDTTKSDKGRSCCFMKPAASDTSSPLKGMTISNTTTGGGVGNDEDISSPDNGLGASHCFEKLTSIEHDCGPCISRSLDFNIEEEEASLLGSSHFISEGAGSICRNYQGIAGEDGNCETKLDLVSLVKWEMLYFNSSETVEVVAKAIEALERQVVHVLETKGTLEQGFEDPISGLANGTPLQAENVVSCDALDVDSHIAVVNKGFLGLLQIHSEVEDIAKGFLDGNASKKSEHDQVIVSQVSDSIDSDHGLGQEGFLVVNTSNGSGAATHLCPEEVDLVVPSSVGALKEDGMKCSLKNENKQTDTEVTVRAGDMTPSREGQMSGGLSHDKDGGSSMDSTAGSGWKLDGDKECAVDNDENSSHSEDSASSPICVQPLQQRKRINIHHQFVREIVKIQHDREQYDREQIERQIQAQNAANIPHQILKTIADSKEQSTVGKSQVGTNSLKSFASGSLSDPRGDRQRKVLQQRHGRINKKGVLSPATRDPKQSKESLSEGIEASEAPHFSEEEAMYGSRQPTKSGRHKQLCFMPIYRPPNAREADDQLKYSDLSNQQSASFVMSNSPDGSISSVSECNSPSVGSPGLEREKGMLTVVKSSSGERYVHYMDSDSEQSTLGMGIKVTFDTEKQTRHIEISESLDSGRVGKTIDMSGTTPGNSLVRNSPTALHGSALLLNKATGSGDPSSSSYNKHPLRREKGARAKSAVSMGTAAVPATHDRSSLWLQEGTTDQGSEHPQNNQSKHTGGFDATAVTIRSTLHSCNSGNSSHLEHTQSDVVGVRPVEGRNSKVTNGQSASQSSRVNNSRNQTDSDVKQKAVASSERGKKKRDSRNKHKHKEHRPPLVNQLQDIDSSQAKSGLSRQASSISETDYQVTTMSGKLKENADGLSSAQQCVESDKRSKPENVRKEGISPLQTELTPLSVQETAYYSTPLSGKWGDIVDDFPDNYDFLQTSPVEVGRHGNPDSLLYRAESFNSNNSGSSGHASPRTRKSRAKRLSKEKGPGRAMPGDGQQKANMANKTTKSTLGPNVEGTPSRKSVWERLGPQTLPGDSILGPPPKVLEDRGVPKRFPDVALTNSDSKVPGGFDFGVRGPPHSFHGSYLPRMVNDNHFKATVGVCNDNESKEVVVQAYRDTRQTRSKHEVYVPRRGF